MGSFHTLKFEKISDCWSFSNLKTLTGCRSFYSHSKYTVFSVFAKDLGHRGWPRKHIKSLAKLPQSFLRPASTPKCSSRLEAFNKIISGFVTSVLCKVIAGKYVVRASVRHSQRVNDEHWFASFPKTMGLFCQSIAWDEKLDWLAHISRVLYFI